MSKAYLRKVTGNEPNTMTWLRCDEEVTLTVLRKVAAHLMQILKKYEISVGGKEL